MDGKIECRLDVSCPLIDLEIQPKPNQHPYWLFLFFLLVEVNKLILKFKI